MVTLKKAYEIAKEEANGFELQEVRDAGDMWIFIFTKRMKNGMIYPQSPNITVDKESGVVGKLIIPPIENLHIINKAKVINFKE